MRLKEFTITRGATINLGEYESARVDFALTYEVQESDFEDVVVEACDKELRDTLTAEVERIKGSTRGKSPRRFVEGA